MIKIVHGLALGGIMAAAAVGLSSTASAEPASGHYVGSITDTYGSDFESYTVGQQLDFDLNPCGTDCLTLAAQQFSTDLYAQDGNWVGTDNTAGYPCTVTLGGDATTLALDCAGHGGMHYSVVKSG